MELWAQFAPLLVVTLVLVPAAYQDVRTRRIPNLLSLGGFLAGCVTHGIITGPTGAGVAFGSGLMLMVALFPFFIFGWLGAGDVKLIAAVGAICGSFGLALIALVVIVTTGAVFGLLVLAWRKGLKNFVKRMGLSFALSFINRRLYYVDADEADATGDLPYAVAIAVGGILTLLAQAMQFAGLGY